MSLTPAQVGGAVERAHAQYRASRQRHTPPDEHASSRVTFTTLKPHLLRWGLMAAAELVIALVSLPVTFGAFLTSVATGTAGAGAGGAMLVTTLAAAAVLVAWVVSWFLPAREPVGEYGVLHEGRAAAAGAVHAQVHQTLLRRRSPVVVGEVTAAGQHLLTLRNGRDMASLVVAPYGDDLYVGWTMWRQRSTLVVVAHLLRDVAEVALGSTHHNDVRLAATKAMRELVHSAVREGLEIVTCTTPGADAPAPPAGPAHPALPGHPG